MNYDYNLQRLARSSLIWLLLLCPYLPFSVSGNNTFPASGKVGVGTTAPQVYLDVEADTPQVRLGKPGQAGRILFDRASDGLASGKIGFRDSLESSLFDVFVQGGGGHLALGGQSKVSLYTGDVLGSAPERLTILSDGKLGVGNPSPRYSMDVAGSDIRLKLASGNGIHLRTDSYGNSYINNMNDFVSNGNTNNGFLKITAQTELSFATGDAGSSGTSRMTILGSTGFIGIGTTAPDYMLDINGTARAKEVIVESNWADFVFEPGYDLPSIEEVEAHIQSERRLPGMPSAEAVREHGVSIGETQTLLLQKVEELTLYLIEQEKQLEAQRKELEALKTLNLTLLETVNFLTEEGI